jgi:hypothetical protein
MKNKTKNEMLEPLQITVIQNCGNVQTVVPTYKPL